MLGKIRIKGCHYHNHHEIISPPHPYYYGSYTTKSGTEIYYCIRCHERIISNLENYKIYLKEEKLKREEESKKNLEDCYVKKELLKGIKNKYEIQDKLPNGLIELKRVSLKLQQLIENKKKPQMECRKHGKLYSNNVIKSGCNKSGTQRYKCRECMSDLHRDYYERKKDYVLYKCMQYRKNNPEKVKEIKANSWRKNRVKHQKHAAIKGKSITSN